MSYTVPTLEELVKEGLLRHRAELPGTDAFLWPNTEHVFVKTVAGLIHLNFQYLEWIKRQRFATEADAEQLDAHGKPFGLERNPASTAHGVVSFAGVAGTTVPASTLVSRSDGVQFATQTAITLSVGGVADATVYAVDPGRDGNTTSSAVLALTAPITGIADVTVGADGLGGGAEVEDDEAYRSRILFRMRNPPRGGAAHDYIAWALSISGVTRVWVAPLAYGPGTVAVWFMTDGATTDGIPNAVALQDVQDYIAGVKPVTARVVVQAPIAAPINVCVSGLGAASQTLRDQIDVEIADVFRRNVQVSTPSEPYILPVNVIWQAVARVTGSAVHKIATPSADVSLLAGYIPTLGSISYID